MGMKRIISLICLLAAMVLLMSACGKEKRTVTCDGCGEAIIVEADSNITDEWIVFCKTCEKELFGDEGVVSEK